MCPAHRERNSVVIHATRVSEPKPASRQYHTAGLYTLKRQLPDVLARVAVTRVFSPSPSSIVPLPPSLRRQFC
jgi:hypothetical protein